MKTHIDTLVEFVTLQMDGQQVPPKNSAELERLAVAVKAHQKASDHDHQLLALRIVAAVIDRVRASIGAEATLHRFLRGEDHDD